MNTPSWWQHFLSKGSYGDFQTRLVSFSTVCTLFPFCIHYRTDWESGYLNDPLFMYQPHASTLLPLIGPLSSGIIYCSGRVFRIVVLDRQPILLVRPGHISHHCKVPLPSAHDDVGWSCSVFGESFCCELYNQGKSLFIVIFR